MRVFVTGATGALGRHLVPALVAAGHEVTATTRTPSKAGPLREVGADGEPFNPMVHEAVARIESDQVTVPTVSETLVRGYMLHDRLLRPAMVKVAKA